jgi:hypothetical protein
MSFKKENEDLYNDDEYLYIHRLYRLNARDRSLNKRKYSDAFGEETFDDLRYSFGEPGDVQCVRVISKADEVEILKWCDEYLASKKN